jgi:hypothetical protein
MSAADARNPPLRRAEGGVQAPALQSEEVPLAEPLNTDEAYRGWLTRVPEYLALVALGVLLVVTWEGSLRLPARIPTHFGVSGLPDGWGPKGMFYVTAVIPVLLYLGLTAVQRYRRKWNYPVRVTEENHARLELVMVGLLRWTKAETVALFVYLQGITVQVATGAVAGLSNAVMFGAVGLILGTAVFFIVWARRVA